MLKFLSFFLMFVFFEFSESQTLSVRIQQHKRPDDYLYVPALTDSEKRELKEFLDRITDDVIHGNNETEAEEVYNS